jgi:type VI secretion system protein ImpK
MHEEKFSRAFLRLSYALSVSKPVRSRSAAPERWPDHGLKFAGTNRGRRPGTILGDEPMNAMMQRTQNLASCYENALTIILRLASLNQQSAANSQDFRTSIRAALKAAMEQAKGLGYSSEINQLAFFAVVSLLDESVLKLQSPAFADWAQRPMQEEMFGHNRAGEVFFDNLRTLLTRQDAQETADSLEVYCLCMLLGFKGKYALVASIGYAPGQGGAGARYGGEIQTLIRQAREKIDRIRGAVSFLPDAATPEVKKMAAVDRWSRGLGIAALVLLVLVLSAFGGFWFLLSSGAAQIS